LRGILAESMHLSKTNVDKFMELGRS